MSELRCAECDCRFGGTDCNWIVTSDWRPIDTAPKDSELIVLIHIPSKYWTEKPVQTARWAGYGNEYRDPVYDEWYAEADYWMPVPKPPMKEID